MDLTALPNLKSNVLNTIKVMKLYVTTTRLFYCMINLYLYSFC